MIKDQDTIALSGFTPNGVPKATFRELSKRAVAEHEAGRPFQVGILTGASTSQSIEGDMAAAHAIKFRAPFSTNKDFRTHTNLGEIDYEDMHLGHMAERLRRGFYGEIDLAIIEVSDLEEGETTCKAFLTSAGGIVPTIVRLAKKVLIEKNTFHSPASRYLHDVYEIAECPFRTPIPIMNVGDRIGKEYVEIDAHKIVGVIECNIPEEARAFKPLDPITEQMGHNVADFLVSDLKKGHIPPQFLPLQSGVGVTSNAVLEALGQNPNVPVFSVYTEVVQDAVVKYMREGRIKDASCSSLTVTNDTLKEVYDDIDYFKQHLTIRQSEISNSPEVIRRLGVIAMNTAIECDIYGNENSSHICGSKLMNGIGGSCDYERNGYISIFTTQSTTKNGCISAIVPMCSHVDSTEHDVDVIVTEQGVADLRGKGPLRRAKEIIENCAHPDYRPMLREYLKFAEKGHEPQSMRAALAMHDTFLKKGGKMAVYSCQIYANGNLIRDFVPCVDFTGNAGLYDLVGGKFYGNAGTGSFTAGPVVTWDEPEEPTETLDPYTWYESDVPVLSQMARYRANVAAVRAALRLPEETPGVPETMRWLTTAEANSIEAILLALNFILNNIPTAVRHCGVTVCGSKGVRA